MALTQMQIIQSLKRLNQILNRTRTQHFSFRWMDSFMHPWSLAPENLIHSGHIEANLAASEKKISNL